MPDGMSFRNFRLKILIFYAANKNHALNSLIGAAFGGKSQLLLSVLKYAILSNLAAAAGQRCMAISVGQCSLYCESGFLTEEFHTAVLVGDAQAWLPELVGRAQKLKVNQGFEQGADLYVLLLFGRAKC